MKILNKQELQQITLDNPSYFRKNLLMRRLEIKKKLQYDINRETTEISALSSGKIVKYEYLPGEVLPTDQSMVKE